MEAGRAGRTYAAAEAEAHGSAALAEAGAADGTAGPAAAADDTAGPAGAAGDIGGPAGAAEAAHRFEAVAPFEMAAAGFALAAAVSARSAAKACRGLFRA